MTTTTSPSGFLARRRAALRGDDGVSAIVVALFVVMIMLPVSAIAVDLGNGYANRRQVQNAADAASMAAADALGRLRAGSPTNVAAVAQRVATANDNGLVQSCELVRVTYTAGAPDLSVVGTCGTSAPAEATGVRVTTTRAVDSWFGAALPGGPVAATSAGGVATASLQKASGGYAPFALCSFWDPGVATDKHADWPDKDPSLTVLLADGTLNPSAVGKTFPLWSAGNNTSHCGLDAAKWKGLACDIRSYGTTGCAVELPTVDYDNGAKTGPMLTTVAGQTGCTPATIPDSTGESPCTMALPVCTSGDKLAGTLTCPVFGAFRLSYVNSGKTIVGTLLGPATLVNAIGSAGAIGPDDSVTVGLVG